jgi:hypothetical protein
MQTIGISGVRELTRDQERTVRAEMRWELLFADKTHVGCARGVDALARELVQNTGRLCVVHETEGHKAWQLQARSRKMVDALAQDGGELHAWVNKPCPEGLTVKSWAGSGTWGTACYASSKGVPVVLHKLVDCPDPSWLRTEQLAWV